MHRRVLCIVAGIAAVCAAAVFLVAGCGRTERAGDELTRTQEGTETAQTDALAARWRINPICIDAGHGGRDSGTLGADGALEKTITLDIAGRVRRRLEAEGATVVMTRTDDRFVSLDARASTSNKAAAGLFVSIHANGFHEPDVRGFEIYYFNGAHSSKAVEAAEAIERAMHDALDTRDRGVRRADFSVLAATQCPAVLVEVGYMTNPDEAARLARADYRQQIADALVAAIKTVGMDESAEPAAEGQ